MNAPAEPKRIRAMLRLLALAAFLFVGFAATPQLHAQGLGGDPQQMLQQRVELYTTRLKLDAAQSEQVKQILTKQMEEMRTVFEKANGDFAAVREQMQPIRAAANAKIEALLTRDEQKAAYKTLQEEEAARRRQRMGGNE